METSKQTLEQERMDLTKALKNNLITTNEYQDFYYAISQRIKRLN